MEPERASRAWARSRTRTLLLETLAEGLTGAIRVALSPLTAPAWRRRIRALLARPVEATERPFSPGPGRSPRVFLVAGEPSGDQRAADLVLAMRSLDPGVDCEGFGGPRMESAGVRIHRRMDHLPVMGFLGVIGQIRTFADLLVELLVRLRRDPPDVLVLVDYPGFNLRAARAARPLGILTVEYVAPQVWAWAPWRIPTIARSVDLIMAVLPFEPRLFAGRPVRVEFTGHPLAERIEEGGLAARRDASAIGLLPGSRRHEVERLLPLMLATAERIAADDPDARFVVPAAGAAVEEVVRRITSASRVPVEVVSGDPHEAMTRLRTALVASGTATLELALLGVPMVIVYPISPLQRLLRRALLIAPHFGLANIAAGRRIVEERLVGGGAREASDLASSLERLHRDGPERATCLADLASVRRSLAGRGAAARAARAVLSRRTADRERFPG